MVVILNSNSSKRVRRDALPRITSMADRHPVLIVKRRRERVLLPRAQLGLHPRRIGIRTAVVESVM